MSPGAMKDLTLETIAGGAAGERFQDELDKVIGNIMDPNTDAEEKRKIVMTFSFSPAKGRNGAEIELSVASKLAPPESLSDQMYLGRDAKTGEIVGTRWDPEQLELGENAEDRTVLPLKHVQQGGKS